MKNKSGSSLLDCFDNFFCFSGEQIENNGEDSIAFSANENAVMVSVFDGCGGAGAERYDMLSGKSGAYIASRACAGAMMQWFQNGMEGKPEDKLAQALAVCTENSGERGAAILGDLFLDFPTTASIAISRVDNGEMKTDFLWAGDSRGYVLVCGKGLFQITVDDLECEFDDGNLMADSRMTNLVSASPSRPWHLNHSCFQSKAPHIVITATDGCFSYMSSPMEFEYVLLDTMLRSESPMDWQERLFDAIGSYAQDDFTFSAAAFGFHSFEEMQAQFAQRRDFLYSHYISHLPVADSKEMTAMWREYKKEYLKYR